MANVLSLGLISSLLDTSFFGLTSIIRQYVPPLSLSLSLTWQVRERTSRQLSGHQLEEEVYSVAIRSDLSLARDHNLLLRSAEPWGRGRQCLAARGARAGAFKLQLCTVSRLDGCGCSRYLLSLSGTKALLNRVHNRVVHRHVATTSQLVRID